MGRVYLDHAAATPVRKPVLEAMLPYFDEHFGNPSAVYDIGTKIKGVLDEQREKVAGLIGASPKQIVFTSSGAEANNLAVKGAVLSRKKRGNHIIVSAIEHHSVLNSVRFLERLDYEVTFLPVDQYGVVTPERLLQSIDAETVLVSIMHANNEIGTIEPIAQLASICREREILFHTDAVASAGNIPVDVTELDVDLLSLSAAPLGGPKGVGALYFRKGTRLMPLIHGGIQEDGRRGGTENVPGIVGFGKAAELAAQELPYKAGPMRKLRDRLVGGIQQRVESSRYTGHPENRLPGHASFCFEGIEGESLVFMLSQAGIYSNTGSACASKALKTSPVLAAIGVPAAIAQGSLVLTLDPSNTSEEIDRVLDKLPPIVERLRMMSPVWGRKKPIETEPACVAHG